MPLRLDIKKKLYARTDRVKCSDFHPTEAWALAALYSGNLFIWDYNTQTLVKQIEVCNLPVRCAKFVFRKQWIVTGSDDMQIRAFNYNTLERVHAIEAHSDYIRYLAVHPTLSYLLSGSDDMTIRLWDWDKNWQNTQTFEGHAHYVMMVQWNPKDDHIFASCSLDRSVRVWGITGGSTSSHFSLDGHTKGVNCVEYSPSGEKPYLVSGADDKTVRVWDYQTRRCVHTLVGHEGNVTAAVFHPTLPIIMTGSEDGTLRVWHQHTYRLETTLRYLLERCWSIAVQPGSNHACIGFDEGAMVIKLGSDEPIASMKGGKIIWAKGNEIQTVNLKLADDASADGEKITPSVKDMGSCEIFPQSVAHHPNGRVFAVCGDGEYVIYTAQALRNKSFGSALDFAWSTEGHYATRDASGKVAVFHDFKEAFAFKPPFAAEEIFGGDLLAVRSSDFVCFYDWSEYRLVRRIDVTPRTIIWSLSGEFAVLVCPDSFFVLKYDKSSVTAALAAGQVDEEDGVEEAFDLLQEVNEKITSGYWVSESFVYTTVSQRLQCLTAGQTETLAHMDGNFYLLGYFEENGKLYLVNKELELVTYVLNLAFVNYQAATVRKDVAAAEQLFEEIPEELHNRVARFLEHQGQQERALEITRDPDHKYDLAMGLGKFHLAADIIEATDPASTSGSTIGTKWKSLGDAALEQGDFALARKCFTEAKDMSALFLMSTANGDSKTLKATAEQARAEGKYNIAVTSYLLLGDLNACLDVLVEAGRLPEAGFFARTYCPSQLKRVVTLWKEDLKKVNEQVAASLADPTEHAELFPDYDLSVRAEALCAKKRSKAIPAKQYTSVRDMLEMQIVDEMKSNPNFEKDFLGLGGAPAPVAAAPAPAPAAVAPPVAAAPAPVPEPVPVPEVEEAAEPTIEVQNGEE